MDFSLRELQLCELGILKEVKRVCDEHGIVYYLCSGTLLGAVRHQGFIPWDDDIDIAMPYPEYNRFLKIAQTELGDCFYVQNHDTDPAYNYLFTKIRKNNTTMLSIYEKGTPGHHGVWIDVFPIISISGRGSYLVRKISLRICNYSVMDTVYFATNKEWIRSQTNALLFSIVKLFLKLPERARERIFRLFEQVVFSGQNRKNMLNTVVWAGLTKTYPKEIFEGKAEEMRFEDEQFTVPARYDEYLRMTYGEYMIPPAEDKRNGGHGDLIIDLDHSWEKYNIS